MCSAKGMRSGIAEALTLPSVLKKISMVHLTVFERRYSSDLRFLVILIRCHSHGLDCPTLCQWQQTSMRRTQLIRVSGQQFERGRLRGNSLGTSLWDTIMKMGPRSSMGRRVMGDDF